MSIQFIKGGVSMNTLGDRIKQLRNSKDLTQEGLSQMLGMTKQAISGWERNVASPDYKQLCHIADLFNVSVDYLLTRTDFPSPFYLSSNGELSIFPMDTGLAGTSSFDLKGLLLTPNAKLHLGGNPLSMKDRQMVAELVSTIFGRFQEVQQKS